MTKRRLSGFTQTHAARKTADPEFSVSGTHSPGKAGERLPYPAYIPGRIARLRKSRCLSQQQVASSMGIRQQTYSAFEHGDASMNIEEFVCLARLFNVSVDFITGASNLLGEFPRI